jgi:WD40 repeat protein
MRGGVLLVVVALAGFARAEVGFVEEALPAGAVARLGTHLWRHGHTVSAVDWSRDGSWVATASWDKTSRVFDVASGREVSQIKMNEGGSAVAISPDKSVVASGNMKKTVVIWDPRTGKEIRRIADNTNTPFLLRFSPDGKRLAWVAGKTIRVWDAAEWKEILSLGPELVKDDIRPVSISGDTKWAVTVRDDKVDVWDLTTGRKDKTIEGHRGRVQAVTLNGDGSLLATMAGDSVLRVIDVRQGRILKESEAVEQDGNWKMMFAGGDRLIVAGGHDGELWVFDREAGELRERVAISGRRDAWLMGMGASPDGKYLAAGCTDKAIRLFDISGARLKRLDGGHLDSLNSALFVNGGKSVATASDDGRVLVWDAASGKQQAVVEGTGYAGLQMAADAAGKCFAVSNEDPTLAVFDGATLKPVARVTDRLVAMHNVAMSADGSVLAAVERHATVRVIDAKTGAERCRIAINPRMYAEVPVAVSPDGRLVAVGSGDPDKEKDLVRLFDSADARELKVLGVGAGSKLNGTANGALAFSPDGNMLAVAAWGRPIELWEVSTGRRREKLTGDGDAGTCVAFSPDGRFLAAGGGPDKPTVRVWDVMEGKMVAKFVGGHGDWLRRVAWSPDSSRIVSCGGETVAYVWDVPGATRSIERIVEADLDASQIDRAIAALGGEDAEKAWGATRVLHRRPQRAVTALAAAIKPVVEQGSEQTDRARVKELIERLDADTFRERDAAQRELAKLGEAAGPAMREAARVTKSEEVRSRLGVLLAKLSEEGAARSAEGLRALRGIEALERIGTPAAREVLERIARERAGSVVSAAAAAAVRRVSGTR